MRPNSEWLRNGQTQELSAGLVTAEIPAVTTIERRLGGTYVAKKHVYDNEIWIRPACHLQVIRALDALVPLSQSNPNPGDHGPCGD